MLIFNAFVALSSPQIGDLYIIGNDTFSIDSYPLFEYFEKFPNSELEIFLKRDNFRAISLNRGYIATWKIENDSIFLIDINIKNKEVILKKTFNENYKNNKVFAFWISYNIYVPNGKLIWMDSYTYWKIYEKEICYKFHKGKLRSVNQYVNYIHEGDKIPRGNTEDIQDTIFSQISYNIDLEFVAKDCNFLDYLVTINSNGKISKIRLSPIWDTKWQNYWYSISEKRCRKRIKKSIKQLNFDNLRMYGKPFYEKIYISFYYDKNIKKLIRVH